MAKKEGISDDELGAAQSIVMAVAAGRIKAQLAEVGARTRPAGQGTLPDAAPAPGLPDG